MHWIKHVVVEMDESMIQRCVICGAIIRDYTNVSYLIKDGPPKGFATGDVYVSVNTNPTCFIIFPPSSSNLSDCKK
jgi:hypothetical protein